MGVDLSELIETSSDTYTGPAKLSHIVDRGDDERPAQAIVLEAMVNGTTLTALCGHKWVPSRDPKNFPVCEKCMEMFEFAKDLRGV